MINNLTKIILILLYYSQVLPGYDCRYFVVVDGGSTGTRMHIFHFYVQEADPKVCSTVKLKYNETLSSFSNERQNWGLLNILLNNLTSEASKWIPKLSASTTPFYIQAKAGVRQLPSELGARILNKIRQELSRSSFAFSNDYVNILTANEEGKYAWITVNFLLGKLTVDGREKMNTSGVMDLGGSSTQIAFVTNNSNVVTESMTILSQVYKIYSRGYDGMGINDIRLKFFGAEECSRIDCSGRFFVVPCIHYGKNYTYKYKDISFTLGGVKKPLGYNPFYRLLLCYRMALNFTKTIFFDNIHPFGNNFFAINEFYNIVKNVQTILIGNSFKNSKEASAPGIGTQSINYCENNVSNVNQNPFHHFICMDLKYLDVLFNDRYNSHNSKKMIFINKIQNIKLSWALGFAISKF